MAESIARVYIYIYIYIRNFIEIKNKHRKRLCVLGEY